MILLIIIDTIIEKIKKDQRMKLLCMNGPIYTIQCDGNSEENEATKKKQFVEQQFREMREYFGDKFG